MLLQIRTKIIKIRERRRQHEQLSDDFNKRCYRSPGMERFRRKLRLKTATPYRTVYYVSDDGIGEMLIEFLDVEVISHGVVDIDEEGRKVITMEDYEKPGGPGFVGEYSFGFGS